MAMWRVWNKHPYGMTHKEKFREDTIEIKAGEYMLMDYEDAVQFKGQFFPMKKKPTGEDDPAGFKCIFLEKHDENLEMEKPKEYISHIDGKKFQTQAMLDQHLKQYDGQSLVDEEIEAEIEKTKGRGKGKTA